MRTKKALILWKPTGEKKDELDNFPAGGWDKMANQDFSNGFALHAFTKLMGKPK
jgi:hypothetical protein